MAMSGGKHRFSGIAAAFIVLVLLGTTPVLIGAGRNPRKGQATAPQKAAEKQAEYAGSETCALCHEAARAAALSYHVQLETNQRHGWAGRGCEACHGPGKAHAESGGNEPVFSFLTAAAARVTEACLSCHAQGLRGAGRSSDAHARNAVSCVACHSVHKPKLKLLVADKPEALCGSCHTGVRAEFSRPYRHKLQEGAMSCVDCHNPHGTPRRTQLHQVAGNDVACVKCHGDKRGPFVFEHPPAVTEGCAACHEPHGSVNPRMLNRPEQRFLCLECHTNSLATLGGTPPAFHDLRSPRFQNCTSCHSKIHGSYVNRVFLR